MGRTAATAPEGHGESYASVFADVETQTNSNTHIYKKQLKK